MTSLGNAALLAKQHRMLTQGCCPCLICMSSIPACKLAVEGVL